MLSGLLAALGLQHLVLWRFLDFAPLWLFLVAMVALLAICVAIPRLIAPSALPNITLRRLAFCGVVSLVLYVLGGEGRFLYSNFDWQIRDAVLRDMIVNPWPFAYTDRGTTEILRAPIGMYLFPALAGKAFGLWAADLALLAQNTILLAGGLALGSVLFVSTRARLTALAVFLVFSGMDFLGQYWGYIRHGAPFLDHMEWWPQKAQFSSHATLAFWVPQHALAGWIGALLFLLWKDGRLPLGIFLAVIPPLTLWSPLSIIGVLPFAAFAGIQALYDRSIRIADMALPAATTILSLPGLLYLAASGDSVGFRFLPMPAQRYLIFQALETLPYLALVMIAGLRKSRGAITWAIVASSLLWMPFVQIGQASDFMMRATITSFAILAVMVADALASPPETPARRLARMGLLATLAIGAITPALEVRRSLIFQANPYPRCSFIGAWQQAEGFPTQTTMSTYLAPIASLPALMQPAAVALVEEDKGACWSRPWQRRR